MMEPRNMPCDSVQQAIPLYLYGELPAEVEEAVEAHTAGCKECSKELEMHREFARSLNDRELEPTLDLLVDCRRGLAVEIKKHEAEAVSPSLASVWRRIFGFPVNNLDSSSPERRNLPPSCPVACSKPA
jgi:anti-sigma factor RsiW